MWVGEEENVERQGHENNNGFLYEDKFGDSIAIASGACMRLYDGHHILTFSDSSYFCGCEEFCNGLHQDGSVGHQNLNSP